MPDPHNASAQAEKRIRATSERWFLADPLLFGVWSTHRIVAATHIKTIRVSRGAIEFNPRFIATLTDDQLTQVLRFEALRILLKHPYQRRQEKPALAYLASNITIEEYWRSNLPFPNAAAVFGSHDFDRQFFEFYYQKLADSALQLSSDDITLANEGTAASLAAYANENAVGEENSAEWDDDELMAEQINHQIQQSALANDWGTIAGDLRERVRASLHPQLDFRHILRQFRQSMLASRRHLTRMRPSRRYGFTYMGSRRAFSTRLLVAIDVSGSMQLPDIGHGLAVINRFFSYGIESIDLLQFDSEIKGEPQQLKRARQSIEIVGRGGTKFSPLIDYIDKNRGYDGLIIYTDGIAPAPPAPVNRQTRLLWLFNNESAYRQIDPQLSQIGLTAFMKNAKIN